LAAAEGREPEHVLILPGLSPMIAGTEGEAHRLSREVNELTDPEVGRKRLSGRFGGHDFSHLPLDRPLSPQDFPPPESVEAARSRTEVILNLVRRDKPTLRQLLGYLAGCSGAGCFAPSTAGRCCASITVCRGRRVYSTIPLGEPSCANPLPVFEHRTQPSQRHLTAAGRARNKASMISRLLQARAKLCP
jgi:hypothetical protein